MTISEMKKSDRGSAKAPASSPLERYVALLERIAAHPGMGAPELTKLSGLPFPTTHRLLHGLRRAGLVVGGEKRAGFKLAPRLLRLLQTGSDDSWIRITAQRVLDELAERFGETSYLAKLVDDQVVSVAWAAPAGGLHGHVVPGLSQPLHAAACAKAILAHQPTERARSLLANPLPKLCVNTKTSPDEVMAELKAVAAQGYATCVNENEMGVTAIACPVCLADIGVIYSIGIMSLGARFPEGRLLEAVRILKSSAELLATSAGASRGL